LAEGMISPEDAELLHLTDSAAEAVARVVEAYTGRAQPAPAKAG
jgi:predicted Rossmann-fold nucleotide-binding protein